MDFHRLCCELEKKRPNKKGYLKSSSIYCQWNMNLLINFKWCFISFFFIIQITWIVIHFHTQFTNQFLKMLLSSSSCEKNSWSKIWDFMAREVSKSLVFIFTDPLKRFRSRLMYLTLGRHAVTFTDKSKLQRKFSFKFSCSILGNRTLGHSRVNVEIRFEARLRFFTQLMAFHSNSLIWLLDKSNMSKTFLIEKYLSRVNLLLESRRLSKSTVAWKFLI